MGFCGGNINMDFSASWNRIGTMQFVLLSLTNSQTLETPIIRGIISGDGQKLYSWLVETRKWNFTAEMIQGQWEAYQCRNIPS